MNNTTRIAESLGVVVLAAGEGTRMRSSLPKVLHPLCGRSMVGHVVALTDALAAEQTVVVLSEHTLEPVRQSLGERYAYVVQQQRLGTGHAVLQARDLLRGRTSHVLMLYGDSPLLRLETAQALIHAVCSTNALLGLLSFQIDPPTGYGRVLRDAQGQVAALVEERDATPEQRAITECNSGFMCFDADWLWERITSIPLNPIKQEYYVTDLVAMAIADRGPGAAVAVTAADPREAWGVNDRAQLAQAEAIMRERILDSLMRSGVTITDPHATYVDIDVTVGRDTSLFPGTWLRGRTHVGSGCEVGPQSTLVDAVVGDAARVCYSLIEGAEIAPGATIGPFAHLIAKE